MKANAGGFLSTDREKSPQKLFFLCGVPVAKNHTRDVEWRGTAMGVVPTNIIPPRTTRPFIVRPVLQRLVASIYRARLVTDCAAAGSGKTTAMPYSADRQSVVSGKSGSLRVDQGGRSSIQQTNTTQ